MVEPAITSDPRFMRGKPVVAGTRITVESILEKLAAGESIEQILAAHPRLTDASIRAALAFGARAVRTARLARECGKLDPATEQAAADEVFDGEVSLPEY